MHFDRPTKRLALWAALSLNALLVLTACTAGAAGPRQANLPQVQLRVDTHPVVAELADNDEARQIGLMNRAYLAPNAGMLFVFARSETQCMWMKNTLIDLDVAFADESGNILNIEQMKAGTSDIHCSTGAARFALEMNRDWFKQRGIGERALLHLPTKLN